LVKRIEGALIQAMDFRRSGAGPRRVQVYQAIVDAILDGRLPAGSRLPSARQLAQEWRVARGAVDEAFAQLQDEGLLLRRVGDGSYVAHPVPRRTPKPAAPPREATEAAQRVLKLFAPYLAHSRRLETLRRQIEAPLLHPRGWPADDFPLDKWRQCAKLAWNDAWRHSMGYGPAAGLPELRQAIARHVALTRSLACKPEQVVVINSAMQGVETAARVLLRPGDAAWVEDPGHPSLPLLLEMLHLKPTGVPLDEHGLVVAEGRARAPQASFVYLHTLTQYPLGLRTSLARQLELLQWAEASGAWILEGMFNDEIVHRAPAPPALASRDASGRVVLMGTLEGVMFPSLRIAYLVVPERLADIFVAARGLMGDHNALAAQIALARFMDEGHLNTHLRNLALRCGERRLALHEAVAELLPEDVRLSPTETGIHACIHLPPRWSDSEMVVALRARHVGAEALSTRCWQATGLNGLIVSYAAATPAQIRAAVAQIGAALREHERR
jgi:GntR family transcriptional regulator/MocR family aminotransferase